MNRNVAEKIIYYSSALPERDRINWSLSCSESSLIAYCQLVLVESLASAIMQPQYASVPQGQPQPQYQQQQYMQGQPQQYQQQQYVQGQQPQYVQPQYQQQYGQPMYMQPSPNNVVFSPQNRLHRR